MTGIRSWTAEVTAFGVVVKIERIFTHCPFEPFQRPQSGEREQLPIVHFKAAGPLDAPIFSSSRRPTLLLVPPLRTVRESFQLTRPKFPGTLKS